MLDRDKRKRNSPVDHSGSKYFKPVVGAVDGQIDVYAVIATYDVKCPGRQHAIKKLLLAGDRGKGNTKQDLEEAIDAIKRAIQLLD